MSSRMRNRSPDALSTPPTCAWSCWPAVRTSTTDRPGGHKQDRTAEADREREQCERGDDRAGRLGTPLHPDHLVPGAPLPLEDEFADAKDSKLASRLRVDAEHHETVRRPRDR